MKNNAGWKEGIQVFILLLILYLAFIFLKIDLPNWAEYVMGGITVLYYYGGKSVVFNKINKNDKMSEEERQEISSVMRPFILTGAGFVGFVMTCLIIWMFK